MQEGVKKKTIHVFTEQEKKNTVNEFEYYNIKKEKERDLDPESGQPMPTDPFAEQMLSST